MARLRILPAAVTVAVLACGAGAPRDAAAAYEPGGPPPPCADGAFSDQIGTGDRDALAAARRPERLWGLAGPDDLRGSSTRVSCLIGGTGADVLWLGGGGGAAWGESGADRLTGSELDDVLDGGAGHDSLTGEAGNDILIGGPGTDAVDAGAGDDVVFAADGRPELVSCGPGTDRVAADRGDVLLDCEQARVQGHTLHLLTTTPRAPRDGDVVKVHVPVPKAGRYDVLLLPRAAPPPSPLACGTGPRKLATFKGTRAGRVVGVRMWPPAGGWCAGRVDAALIRRGPTAEPVARLAFHVR